MDFWIYLWASDICVFLSTKIYLAILVVMINMTATQNEHSCLFCGFLSCNFSSGHGDKIILLAGSSVRRQVRPRLNALALFDPSQRHRRVEPWRSGYRVGLSVSIPFDQPRANMLSFLITSFIGTIPYPSLESGAINQSRSRGRRRSRSPAVRGLQ
jgi:hypothetical protein